MGSLDAKWSSSEEEDVDQRRFAETDKSRGHTSRAGYGDSDDPRQPQDFAAEPRLAEPAEETANPPTHPKRDDGVGPVEEGEPHGDAPVPKGDPVNEKDRSDVQ
jgi:hypothetical protein